MANSCRPDRHDLRPLVTGFYRHYRFLGIRFRLRQVLMNVVFCRLCAAQFEMPIGLEMNRPKFRRWFLRRRPKEKPAVDSQEGGKE